MHTAELDSVVGCTPQSFNPQWDAHREVWLRGGMHTAGGAFLKYEYLGEIETEFENILACLSGA